MNIIRKAVTTLGGIFLAALLILALAPKAVRSGVIAALVQVTNTSANPVPTVDVNTPAEQPFGTLLCSSLGTFAGQCPPTAPNQFVVPSTTTDGATVKRLVIENLSGSCETGGTTVVAGIAISTTIGENTVDGEPDTAALVPVSASAASPLTVFGQPTRLYADPGSTVGLTLFGSGTDNICEADLNGYLVTK